jgi:hypothetical protein
MIDINVADNPFADAAMQSAQGVVIQRPSGEALVALARAVDSSLSNL